MLFAILIACGLMFSFWAIWKLVWFIITLYNVVKYYRLIAAFLTTAGISYGVGSGELPKIWNDPMSIFTSSNKNEEKQEPKNSSWASLFTSQKVKLPEEEKKLVDYGQGQIRVETKKTEQKTSLVLTTDEEIKLEQKRIAAAKKRNDEWMQKQYGIVTQSAPTKHQNDNVYISVWTAGGLGILGLAAAVGAFFMLSRKPKLYAERNINAIPDLRFDKPLPPSHEGRY